MGAVQGARQGGKTTLVEHGGGHPYVEKSTLKDGAGLYGGFANGEYRLAGETLYLPVVCPRTQQDIVTVQ